MKHQSPSSGIKKTSGISSWNEINRNLNQLSDEEIINLYYQLRDECSGTGKISHFPNIKYLYATPFEREKDRREQQQWQKKQKVISEVIDWYRKAKNKSCVWWLENHVIAKHSASSCMNCGACTALCPAAEFYDFSPREIMTIIQEKNEDSIIGLLKSETIWYCHQCGSCKTKCPRQNSPFGMISSLRQLSQIKGYHIESVRGRQQYFGRHLWGGNLWNRACTLYFRNAIPDTHQDFGPRFETYFNRQDEFMKQVGAHPDMEGPFSGRKVHPETLKELRKLWIAGGAVFFWSLIEEAARRQAKEMNLSIDEYHNKVKTEG
ncbi:MAG: 4Fe-4S dicluster domain-containing protein [Syntrophaceae bacterium]|nr:4Fe-4S dicluster domain-containing protein [Syntrophaceae bacterium]